MEFFVDLLEVAKDCAYWLIFVFPSLYADGFIAGLWELLPDFMEEDLEPYKEYAEQVNYFVPAHEAITALCNIWIFKGTFAVVKIIVKLIPTIG